MEIGLVNGSPQGVLYLPRQPPPEPEGHQSFPDRPTLERMFIQWINSAEGRNRKLLTPKKRSDYRNWLNNPYSKSQNPDQRERRREASAKHHCTNNFELQDSQVYRKPEYAEGRQRPARYCACDYDASDIIQRIHRLLHHASKWNLIRFDSYFSN